MRSRVASERRKRGPFVGARDHAAQRAVASCLGICLTITALSAIANPRSNYLLHCGGCHLENGGGTPPEVPDLRIDLDWIASTPEGRSYLTRVPGASQVPLSDDKLAEVFNWIFDTYYPGRDDIEAFTGAEIARTRPLPLWDPVGERLRLTAERRAAE